MDAKQAGTERAELRAALLVECMKMADESLAAMDQAPANNIIGGSEWGVQEAVMKAKQRIFERLVQAKVRQIDASERASFSPCGPGRGASQVTPAQKQG